MSTELIINEQVSDKYKRAVELHRQIMMNGEIAYNAMVDFCMHLKSMRDEKLYIELGHETFDSYVENQVGIKSRQAYKYIATYENLGSTVLHSNASLGITKLELLTAVPSTDRPDFIQNNDLAGMSVKEIKELIESSKKQEQQISFLQNKVETLTTEIEENDTSDTLWELQQELEKLKLENKKLQKRPIEVAVVEPSKEDIKKIEDKLKADFAKEKAQAIKDAAEKATKKATSDLEKQLEQVKKETADKVQSELKKQLSELEQEKANLLEKSEKQAKALNLKGDTDIVKIMVHFDSLKNIYKTLCNELALIKSNDAEKAEKLKKAISKYTLDNALAMIQEV